MALDYFAPGVYVEEVDRGSRPIEGVSLSVAGFIGFTEDVRDDAQLFQPRLITSWEQYKQYFAKLGSDGFTDFGAYLPFAVRGWFDNGGGRCWVTSIGTKLRKVNPTPEEQQKEDLEREKDLKIEVLTSGGKKALAFKIKSDSPENGNNALAPGSDITPYAQKRFKIIIEDGKLQPNSNPQDSQPQVENAQPNPNPQDSQPRVEVDSGQFFTLKVVKQDGTVLEAPDVINDPSHSRHVVTVLNASEELHDLIEVEAIAAPGGALGRRPKNGAYEVKSAPYITPEGYEIRDLQRQKGDREGIQGNFEIDDIAIIACPDLALLYQERLLNLEQVHGVMEALISNCENSFPSPAFRMVVLDPPPVQPGKSNNPVEPEKQKPQDVAEWLKLFNRRSQFAAVYYPWIKVDDPRNAGKPKLVPPCGHMMGIWCRTDQERGIFKAPANETPRGITGIAYETNIREQELLNPLGINCIRNFNSYNRGIKVWGARTLVEPSDIQWRYISVRRLMSYIEKSIEIGTQWVVFEPNDQDLWERVKRTINSFLEGLWRQGALLGAAPSEAFYVKCDDTINTPDTMRQGRLYVEVGVSPVRPAEFVIFRVSQWSNDQSSN